MRVDGGFMLLTFLAVIELNSLFGQLELVLFKVRV